MNPAIRTVSETDDVHVIEGLGIPFVSPFYTGKDSYGTLASKRTNFYWDLFPDRSPRDAQDVPARYVRPNTFQHGFDEEIGLQRVGGWSPVRQDKMGVWVQAQLDKHNRYYEAIRELLDKDALGFSSASVEHAVRIDDRTGEWLDWPVFELALTPTPSNPAAIIAARSAQAVKVGQALIRISGVRAENKAGEASGPPEGGKDRKDIPDEDFAGPDHSFPIVNQASVDDAAHLIGKADDPEAVKAKIVAIAKRKGLKLPDAWQGEDNARAAFRSGVPSDDAACAAGIMGQLDYLMGREAGEDEQVGWLREAASLVAKFHDAEMAEIGSESDPLSGGYPPAFFSAIREGRRNSGPDLALIDGIHDASVSLGASAHAGAEPPDDESHQEPPADRDAAPLPIRVRMERANAKAIRKATRKALRKAQRIGSEVGASTAAQVIGR